MGNRNVKVARILHHEDLARLDLVAKLDIDRRDASRVFRRQRDICIGHRLSRQRDMAHHVRAVHRHDLNERLAVRDLLFLLTAPAKIRMECQSQQYETNDAGRNDLPPVHLSKSMTHILPFPYI